MRLGRVYAVSGLLLTLLCAVGVLCVLRAQPQATQKQLTIYTAQTTYSAAVLDRDGKEYASLAEVLGPLCRVSQSGRKCSVRCSERETRFTAGQTKVRIQKQDLALSAPPFAESGHVLIPLHDLAVLLPQLLPGRDATLHEQPRRLFLDRSELRYTTELRRSASSQLVLTFSAPVNPSIATEQGKLRMLFRREPVVATTGLENVRFEDRTIPSLSYSEGNGAAELAVSGTVPLTASFSPDRKVITIYAVQRPREPVIPPVPVPPVSVPQAVQPAPVAPGLVVIIDPAHGGEDSGGALGDKLSEKDITLSFARSLYRELDALGIAARLVRDGDTTITPEQRAVMTNASKPSLYIALHASASGGGVYVFTSRLNPTQGSSGFQPWDTAQSASVVTSQAVAASVATELLKRDIPGVALTAALRPLNNVAAPALAVEVASPPNGDKLTSSQYQQTVCKSIAAAIASSRARLFPGGAGR